MSAIAGRAATSAAVGVAAGRSLIVCRGGRDGRGETRELGVRGGTLVKSVRISSRPAVKRLSTEELPRLLPWSGCGERLATEVGDLETCTARVAVSLVACALVYNTSIELASLAAFYWAWAPILGTALPNILLRLRYRYAGIWSARVLQIEVLQPQSFVPDESGGVLGNIFNRLPKAPSTLQLEIGDGSPASFTMEIPLSDDIPEVQVGDRVEVVVVSDEPSLSRFKALRDLYFPDRQAWISEEPCIERELYEDLQRSLNPPIMSYGRNGGADGRRTQPLLEENALSKERANWWGRALRRGPQSGRPTESDYIMNVQEKREERRPVKELDDDDLYVQSSRSRESDYALDVQEKKKERRSAKELDGDDSYLQSGRSRESDYIMNVQEKKNERRPAKELDIDDSSLQPGSPRESNYIVNAQEKKNERRPAKELDEEDLYLQSGSQREADYMKDVQEKKKDRRPAKELDDDDLYLQPGSPRESDYMINAQEKNKERRPAKEQDDDELYLQSGRPRESDYMMDVQAKKEERRPAKELDYDDLYLQPGRSRGTIDVQEKKEERRLAKELGDGGLYVRPGRHRESDYILDVQDMQKQRRPAQVLDYGDLQLNGQRELDYMVLQEKKNERRPAKELDIDDLYMESRRSRELDYIMDVEEKERRPAKELDIDDLYL